MGNLTKGKHVVQEIAGKRCTVVETGVSEERMKFLQNILQINQYEVVIEAEKKEEGEPTYIVGVTDIVFNPVVAIYARKLKLDDGRIVTAAYWNQQTDYIDPRYWRFKVK